MSSVFASSRGAARWTCSSSIESSGLARTDLIEQRDLRLVDLALRVFDREPLGAIDFGELLLPSGPRRPLHAERTARECRRIEIALDGPRVNDLTARLTNRRECDELA